MILEKERVEGGGVSAGWRGEGSVQGGGLEEGRVGD